MKSPPPRWRLIVPAFTLFVAHAAIYGSWQIDDAAISFSYARNLGLGHGLVAQPGVAAVEGFSNPLWVLICGAFAAVGLLHPLWTPKLLSIAAIFGVFFALDRALARTGIGFWPSALSLGLLAAQPAFVIWTISGLENPLYALAFVTLLALTLHQLSESANPAQAGALAGLAAGALALTRPEGVLFAPLWPLANAVGTAGAEIGASRISKPPSRRGLLLAIAAFSITLALPVLAYLLVRHSYFGEWVPNTYHAKGGPSRAWLETVAALGPGAARRGVELLHAAGGHFGTWLGLGVFVAAAFLAGRGRLSREVALLILFAAAGALPYLLLPLDWMPEFRFATPFFAVAYAAAAAVLSTLELRRGLAATLVVAAVASVGFSAVPRARAFAAKPTVPFAEVERRYGVDYNRYADALGVTNGSFLLPDVGGALWTSRLRIHDLGGLCDRQLAHGIRFDRRELHEHVFGTLKPTFVRVHHYWAVRAQFDLDPRFARDYVPLWETIDPWVQKRANASVPIKTGEFVRREVAERKPRAIERIRREIAAAR